MRWVSVTLCHRKQRETNEIHVLNLRVKQALFQLSYDPARIVSTVYINTRLSYSVIWPSSRPRTYHLPRGGAGSAAPARPARSITLSRNPDALASSTN